MPSRTRTEMPMLRWRSIALLSAVLATTGLAGLLLSLPKPESPDTPAPSVHTSSKESQKIYPPTATFAAANDLSVLRAALAGYCKRSEGYYVVSDAPIDRMDNRHGKLPSRIPAELECQNLKIVPSSEIEVIFDKSRQQSSSEMPLANAWEEFYERFSGARGLIKASMPLYFDNGNRASIYIDGSCGALCGSGWNVLLRRDNGKWIVEERTPRWIS